MDTVPVAKLIINRKIIKLFDNKISLEEIKKEMLNQKLNKDIILKVNQENFCSLIRGTKFDEDFTLLNVEGINYLATTDYIIKLLNY